MTRYVPTTDDILNLDGVRRRIDSFRFELCDREWSAIGELHPDVAQSVPSIDNDTTNNTPRRLRSLKLLSDEAADVNVIRDRLRVYMRLQNGVEFLLGSFLWADANQPMRSWGDEQHSDLVDPTFILTQKSTKAFGWDRGGLIGLIFIFLVARAGFELADFGAPLGQEASRTLAEPMSWQPGATWYQMLADLGNLIGFAPPWFDRNGKLHIDNTPSPDFGSPTIPAYGPGTRVVADSIVYSNDLLSAPNEFAVFDSGTGNLVAGRYEVPCAAPHSFANRGFHVALTENVQGLATQAQADRAAREMALSKGVAFEWLSFTSTADPRHDTYDIIDAFDKRWLETSWSLELRPGGPMKHTLRRAAYAE